MLLATMKKLGIEPHRDKKRAAGESLVDWRCRSWGIPKPTFQPIDDSCVVWRLPPLQLTAGGIILPESDRSPHVKGILLAMGPRAADILRGNGIEPGHIIIFGRWAGWETNDQTPEFARHNVILTIKARDVLGSDDLRAEIDAGVTKYVQGDDGRHRVERRRLASSKKEKILEMAKRGGTKAERESAARIAEEME
jgi:co-chaperonin GroES (HSP10)